jgi:putative membrane protein
MKFLKHLVLNFILSGLALWGADYFLDVLTIQSTNVQNYIKIVALAVLVLGLINFFIKPILTLISLPFLIITLGLFTIIIHAIVFFILTILIPEIEVHAFWGYFIIPIILGILNGVVHLLVPISKK